MGQAFDREGNVLGEATGATKHEVLDKLEAQFKDAHEIRIRTMGTDNAERQQATFNPALADNLEKAIAETGDRILPFFRYAHLPLKLQEGSAQFASLAVWCVRSVASSAERTVGLRKILEGKDAIVRSMLP